MKKSFIIAFLPALLLSTNLDTVEASMRDRINKFYENNPFSEFYTGKPVEDTVTEEAVEYQNNRSRNYSNEDQWIINLRKPINWNGRRIGKGKATVSDDSAHTRQPKAKKERPEPILEAPLRPSNIYGYEDIKETPKNAIVANSAIAEVTLFDYEDGRIYEIAATHGYITDVILAPGEKITNVTLGDEQRWEINSFLDRTHNTYHLYIQPVQNGIETNMVIATNGHTYQLLLSAYGGQDYTVAWNYPNEMVTKKNIIKEKPNITIDSVNQLDFDYQFEKGHAWQPQFIFNDGRNTFISFDPDEIDNISPAVFSVNPYDNTLTLVDYEKVGSSIVLNDVYTTFKLRIRNKEILVTHR